MSVILDSYSESNAVAIYYLYANWFTGLAEKFTVPADTTLTVTKAYGKRVGSPTGNAVSKIYAYTGSMPTGTPLAVSDNLVPSTVPTTDGLIQFTFSGSNMIHLPPGDYYVSFEYSGQDANNCLGLYTDSTTPTHGGTVSVRYQNAWVASGGSEDLIFYVYGGITPTASFTSNGTTINTGDSLSFVDTSTQWPTSWEWYFGDEDTSTSQNPTHTYTTAGDYTVELFASNAAGGAAAFQAVHVVEPRTIQGLSTVQGLSSITF